VITLLVSPEDAQKLTLASQEGKIQLSLRNPLDAKKRNMIPVHNAALYGIPPTPPPVVVKVVRHAAKTPLPPPQAVYTVEIIKGHERDQAKF